MKNIAKFIGLVLITLGLLYLLSHIFILFGAMPPKPSETIQEDTSPTFHPVCHLEKDQTGEYIPEYFNALGEGPIDYSDCDSKKKAIEDQKQTFCRTAKNLSWEEYQMCNPIN